MKKSLLALAVLGAFAGAASAQSSVTVYGIVDLGINSSDNGVGRTTGIDSGNQSASRIGFKGKEDLGGGLAATFQLESGFNADTGSLSSTNTLFNRIATVGLEGAFGKVNLGRQVSVIKDAYEQIDPFGDGGAVAPISGMFFGGEGPTRVSNTIKYSTNSYSGFKAQAAYTFGETEGSTSANSAWGVGAGYNNGPLNVQFGYHNADNTDDATLVKLGKDKFAFIGATYNFGAFKLHGAYADTKLEVVGAGETKIRNYLIGGSLPLGPGSLIASYSVNDFRDIDEGKSQKAAIMYAYDLSKRTNLYVGYSHTSNDDNVNMATGHTAALGESNSVATVGIRHKF